MRKLLSWIVVVVTVIHGLIHLLGPAKAFGWRDVTALREPIGTAGGAAWLVAAVLVVAAGVGITVRWRGWWLLAGVAALLSQGMIWTAWSDAWAGTFANVVLLAAAAYGFRAEGPGSARARFRTLVRETLSAAPMAADPTATDVVTEADLARLPRVVAAYLRNVGALGQPHVRNFRVRAHGRIRAGADKPWMPFKGEQVNSYGADARRLFFMDATMFGLPVDVLHRYVDGTATMDGALCSMVPVVHGEGPEMTHAETVTIFNDLCVVAPAALVDAPVTWGVIDANRVRGTYRNGGHTVSAVLVFDDSGELVDFVSEDRLRASSDGTSFTRQRWSTPVTGYADLHGHRIATHGEAHWHAPAPEGEFGYLEFVIDDLEYNLTAA